MKLIPVAKPVRIRIKSGGEEHSSLESLKQNFCLEDIKPLLDGRLSRWLQRLGEKEQQLAEELKKFDVKRLDQAEGQLAFLQLFFAQELKVIHPRSLQEVARYWMNDPIYQRNGGYLIKAFVRPDTKWTDLSLAKAVYKQQLQPNQDWSAIFKGFLNQEDSELYFIYGKLLYEGIGCSKDETTARLYIDKAANLGWGDARNYLNTLRKQVKAEDKRKADEKSSKIRREVIEIIQREMAISSVNDQTPIRYINAFHLKDNLFQRFNISIIPSDLSGFVSVGALADFIMTKLIKDPKHLEIDLEQWKQQCVYAPKVWIPDVERMQAMLKRKYDFEIPLNELKNYANDVYVLMNYVRCKFSN